MAYLPQQEILEVALTDSNKRYQEIGTNFLLLTTVFNRQNNVKSKNSMTNLKPILIKQEGCSDISDNSEEVVLVDPDWMDESASSKNTKETPRGSGKPKGHHNIKHKAKKLEEKSKQIKKGSVQESVTPHNTEQNVQSLESSSDSENNEVAVAPTGGKTLLEILELEMRARAIRALLQKDNTPDGQGSKNATENASQTTTYPEGKLVAPPKKINSGSEKVTPVRNFRKKKRKSDDVIVITPKVVTIDLTDENDVCCVKNKQKDLQRNDVKIGSGIQDDAVEKSKDLCKTSEESCNHFDSKSVAESDGSKKEVVESKPISSKDTPEGNAVQLDSEKPQKAEQHKVNWAQRWLDSKEVKKVVSTSKICGNIRKRIKSAKLAKQNQGNFPKVATGSQEVQGSVDEYQLLPKSSKVLDSVEVIPNTNTLEENITSLPNKELSTEIDSRETSSIEQVQDVTSTKNEISLEISLQEHTVGDSKIVQQDLTNLKIESSQSNGSKLLDSETCACELQVSDLEHSKIQASEIEQFDTSFAHEESETSRMLDTGKPKTFESVDTNIESINSSKGDFTKLDTKSSESQPIIDVVAVNESNQNIERNVKVFEKYSLKTELLKSQSGDTTCKYSVSNSTKSETSKNCVTKSKLSSLCNVTSSKLDIDVISMSSNKMCNLTTDVSESLESNLIEANVSDSVQKPLHTKLAENNNPKGEVLEHNNEPETLEINITDEDLEIDG